MKHYDITIIGGGIVGLSSALALSHSLPTAQIALIEKFALKPNNNATDLSAHSTALTASGQRFYQNINLWDELKTKAEPIQAVKVSKQGQLGSIYMQAQQINEAALGYVIENPVLGQFLLHAVKQNKNIHCHGQSQVNDITFKTEKLSQVSFQQQDKTQEISTELVILADGGQSSLAKKIGIQQQLVNYNQVAILANVSTEDDHQGTSYERFIDHSTIALLPLKSYDENQYRQVMIWITDPMTATTLMATPEPDFLAQLSEAFNQPKDYFKAISPRKPIPLSRQLAKQQVQPGLLLLGNAAHRLHPAGAQSYNLSLRDIGVLAQLLKDKPPETPLGDIQLLQRYVEKQKNDQRITTVWSSTLGGLLSHDKHPFMNKIMGLGLLAFDLTPGVKKYFTRLAAGLN